MKYYFYSRFDSNKEPIYSVIALSRYRAALYFAKLKQMDLKAFLKCYGVSR